jgi:hypothetical protein
MIDASEMQDNFNYDPETGKFTRKKDSGLHNQWKAGREVGSLSDGGYVTLSLHKKNYKAHRVAWAIMTGSWPSLEIDHINGVKDDNRWCNLRQAHHHENMANSKKYRTNKSGYKGVQKVGPSAWMAIVKAKGESYYLGCFGCPTAAYIARISKVKELHGEFMRLS